MPLHYRTSFFVAHHLIEKHGMGAGELLAYDRFLGDVLHRYPELAHVCENNERRFR